MDLRIDWQGTKSHHMNKLAYRLAELQRAFTSGGISGGLSAFEHRLRSDAYGLSRRLRARLNSRNGLVVVPVQGSRMCLRVNDPGFSRVLIRDGIWEPEHTQLMHEELRPGMTGLDLGANLGYFALMEAKLVGPAGRVLAVEPSPYNVDVLRRSVEENRYANLEVHQMAIADECGEQDMWITPESNFCNLQKEDDMAITPNVRNAHTGSRNASRTRVQTITVDHLLEMRAVKSIDFIRMDIEGFEIKATKGMKQAIERTCGPLRLFAEVHNDHFSNPSATIGVWLGELIRMGFKPKALIVPGVVKGIVRNLSAKEFPAQVCQYRTSSPQILLVKERTCDA